MTTNNDGIELFDAAYRTEQSSDDERAALLARREFFPWHLPRKHHIRVSQWCSSIRKLIKKLQPKSAPETKTLGYLTLPGDDLLDIRALRGVIESAIGEGRKLRLRFLGFNGLGSGQIRNIASDYSANDLVSQSWVDERSSIVNSRIEGVADKKAYVHRRVADIGPFDVINLDLTGSVATDPPGAVGLWRTIHNLLEIQMSRKHPWLLFVTSRIDRDAVDDDASRAMFKILVSNIEGNESFSNKILSDLAVAVSDAECEASGVAALRGLAYGKSIILGFGKWMQQAVLPRWEISIESSYVYRVANNDPVPSMVSVVYRFDPCNLPDPNNMAGMGHGTNRSESEIATEMVSVLSNSKDLDKFLNDDVSARDKCRRQAGELMAEAGYDVNAYNKWVDEYPEMHLDDSGGRR